MQNDDLLFASAGGSNNSNGDFGNFLEEKGGLISLIGGITIIAAFFVGFASYSTGIAIAVAGIILLLSKSLYEGLGMGTIASRLLSLFIIGIGAAMLTLNWLAGGIAVIVLGLVIGGSTFRK